MAPTFEAFAKEWTSGELRRKHPDHVREKKDPSEDIQILRDRINPLIGMLHLPEVTLEHAERVMRALPSSRPFHVLENLVVYERPMRFMDSERRRTPGADRAPRTPGADRAPRNPGGAADPAAALSGCRGGGAHTPRVSSCSTSLMRASAVSPGSRTT